MLHIDQFDLISATFEARYDRTVTIWDKSGQYWSAWFSKFPDLKIGSAQPNEVQAVGPGMRAVTGIDKSFVIVERLTAVDPLTERATLLVQLLDEVLGVKVFTRLGFRTVFRRRFKEKSEAAAAILDLGLLRVPRGNDDFSRIVEPEYAVRLEGDDTGMLVRLKAQELSMAVEGNSDLEEEGLKPGTRIFQEVLLDLDYYTLKPVLISQLRVNDWIGSAFHLVRRDSRNFLEGGSLA